ncbi:MAG TPA: carboxypeptidase-like regulatory domain-containing protein [Terracidiphilus sp.]|nr:carboxypeptidase-like regulatory domain-containing protein [Terracidiphilus sp.]
MKRSAHLAGFVVLIALGAAPALAAAASVSGIVRDSSGAPQIGAEVQLLRPDLTVVTSVYTNSKGQFVIASLLPGSYALKAMGPSFLPSLRENLHIRRASVVNLTLNTLYEVMQWLPAQPRSGNAQLDDWAWTLKSAANRPLLRWLEDGPLVVVTDGPGAAPKLKARLMATGQAGTFGESGERITATVEDTPADSRELLARVDFAPGTDAGMESMLGFRQDLGFAGSVESVAAIAVHPEETDGAGDAGVDEAAIHTVEAMHLGPAISAEAGSTEVMARMGGPSPDSTMIGLPFASVAWQGGNTAVHYRMATMVQNPGANDDSEAAAWLPAFSERNGDLVVERGMHQEIGLEHRTDNTGMAVLVYSDSLHDPILEAMTRLAAGDSAAAQIAGAAVVDTRSNLLHAAGPAFATTGMEASVERKVRRSTFVRFSCTNGGALVMPALPAAASFAQLMGAVRARRAQSYSISLSGVVDGTGTRWRASYRWQPDDTVTAVSPYAVNAAAPYLSLHLRQPIHLTRDGSGGLEALLDIRNLLAEGYRPYILSDGSLLIFAQDQRAFRGGLAFTF